jgi:ribokinase
MLAAQPAILVFGDANADIIARVSVWPKPGEECLASNLEFRCGGVAANCAIALTRWQVHPTLIACVGQDPIAQAVLQKLKAQGVDTDRIQTTNRAMTGLLYINVTPNGQRTFFGSRAANRTVRLQPRDLALVKRTNAAILMGYSFLDPHPTQAALRILSEVRHRNGWIALDAGMEPSQKIPEKILQIARKVDLLFVSHEEATALTGKRDPRQAFRKLLKTGVRNVVLKLGKRGCLIIDNGEPLVVPPLSVRAVDSTGAGDAFNAAFLQAKLRNWSAAEAAIAANAAGAAATQVIGAGEQAPTIGQIARILRAHRMPGSWDEVRLRVLRRLSSRSF